MEIPVEFKLFIAKLAEKYGPVLRLSGRGFSQLLGICRYPDGIENLLGHRTDCALVEACCRPILDHICPDTPQEGWLRFIYEELAAGLFPDPTRPETTAQQRHAMDFFLDTLEYLLAQEQRHCPHDPLLDIHWASSEELATSAIAPEYRVFRKCMERDHFNALMRIGKSCMPFDPAAHTIGVNNVAVHGAKLARLAGLPVDIALVSAASLSHDIGKFGCRGGDARRIPYLHYYFTWQVLAKQGMTHIGHVAANHSTWDLEFENLPIESLLLIYADFRVRGQRGEDNREYTKICTLAESYAIILSKLADMTPEKTRRYATVYAKLRDFERFLISRGVSPDLAVTVPQPVVATAPALTSGEETLDALRHLTFDNSLRLMDTFSSDASFEQLLEQARGEMNLQRIRTYLLLFEEYNSYMPRSSKRMTLSFLYELLMHREGDVRRRAAIIMGHILANSGPSYRKELPANAPATAYAPTLMGYFAEAQQLWQDFIGLCLHPDRKISPKHAQRIADSLKVIAGSLFSVCSDYDAQIMAQPLPGLLAQAQEEERDILVSVLECVPYGALDEEDIGAVLTTITPWLLEQEVPLRLILLHYLGTLLTQRPALAGQISQLLLPMVEEESFAVQYARHCLLLRCGIQTPVPQGRRSELFLGNLKNAVHWTVKLVHIDYLRKQAIAQPSTTFHTIAHLSNLLSVSEHLPVREYAGQTLLGLVDLLTVEQRNETVVDLTRELETGQEQISYYIAPVLGSLLCRMPDKELSEGVDYLDELIHAASGSSLRAATAALYTLGAMLSTPQCAPRLEVRRRCLGLLMTGIAHYDPTIHQTALTVLCRDVFGNRDIPMNIRRDCLIMTGKKLLCMLSEPTLQQLTFYNHAAMLNHMYRLLVSCEVEGVSLAFPEPKPVAFFPGTFDPFSMGHKEIVRSICALGFEVYLAIDEFSWSKRTAPKLLRRKIAAISVADQWDVYLFPDDAPVNIAIAEDLTAMAARFPGRKVSLVAGSDVIEGASAYRVEEPGSARYYDHVIFYRATSHVGEEKLSSVLKGNWQLMRLPRWCETISSTRIREAVDKNLDISTLVDPVVQSFIYAQDLYVRSPMFKGELQTGDLYFENTARSEFPQPAAMAAQLSHQPDSTAIYLRSRTRNAPLGWVCGHGIGSTELLFALGSPETAAYVRTHTSGRIFLVDAVVSLDEEIPGIRRLLVGEILARSLQAEYTYGLCRCTAMDTLYGELQELGFRSTPGQPDLLCVDMRSPMVLIQDVSLWIKEPLRSDPLVLQELARTRQKLRRTLAAIHPGRLLLSFDAEVLNQSLSRRVQTHNPPIITPGRKPLGPYMCVPYGEILSGQVVPNTVTKTLHSDKVYTEDLRRFSIAEAPGYSSLGGQIRTLKSFRRPVILVDDLLHRGHRMAALDHLFKEEQVEVKVILVGILSGQGRDLMLTQGREVDCEYYIPNLNQWLTESSLYPFLGGNSMARPTGNDWSRPAVNMVLPYVNPTFLPDRESGIRLSVAALENARDILSALERQHLAVFSTAMTVGRMADALFRPRLPDRGRYLHYDMGIPPSAYVAEDLAQLRRITMKEVIHGL